MNEDDDLTHLIENIKKVAKMDQDYSLRVIYHDVADALASDRFYSDMWPMLLNVLKPLHYPEHRNNFEPSLCYNQIRQLVEKIFRACHDQKLLPDVCVEKGRLNLWESYNYLAGNDLNYNDVRFGEKGECVLPAVYSNIIKQILFVSNEMSHTSPTSQYADIEQGDGSLRNIFETTGASNLLFSYALQLCDIIVWLDRYFKEHNIEENYKKQKSSVDYAELIAEAKETPCKVFIDAEGNVYCGKCYMTSQFKYLAVQEAVIIPELVEVNRNKETKRKYPLICKTFTPIPSDFD